MSNAGQLSRRQFVIGGAMAAAAGIAGCGSSRTTGAARTGTSATRTAASTTVADATASAPSRIAYGIVFQKGKWVGPINSGGSADLSVISAIVAQHAGQAAPLYVRLTNAGDSSGDLATPSTQELGVIQQLRTAGVRVGVAINTLGAGKHAGTSGAGAEADSASSSNSGGHHHHHGRGAGTLTSAVSTSGTSTSGAQVPSSSDLIDLGQQLHQMSDAHGGLYDWIFLDHASELTPAGSGGVNDLQQVVDGLSAAGWSQVMINASTFNEKHFDDLPERTWAMARHFGVMGEDYKTVVPKVVAGQSAAVTSDDEAFIDYVHANRASSAAILKLEVPSEVARFRLLSVSDQQTLLRLWAQAGQAKDFHIIYPLVLNDYDSQTVGTLTEQRQLMAQYG